MAAEPKSMIGVELHRRGTTSQVVVWGEVDIATVPVVAAPLNKALSRRPETLVLDLGNVDFLEVRFADIVKRFAARAGALGVRFVLVPPSGVARRAFDRCGLEEVLASDSDRPGQVSDTPSQKMKSAALIEQALARRHNRWLSAQMDNIARDLARFD